MFVLALRMAYGLAKSDHATLGHWYCADLAWFDLGS
jgi:hypothetical protein